MMFTKRLREGVRQGRITCSVRSWKRPHVKMGGIYPMEDGHIIVDTIQPISLTDVTGELARRSGFKGVVDLIKVASIAAARTSISLSFIMLDPLLEAQRAPSPRPWSPPRSARRRGSSRP